MRVLIGVRVRQRGRVGGARAATWKVNGSTVVTADTLRPARWPWGIEGILPATHPRALEVVEAEVTDARRREEGWFLWPRHPIYVSSQRYGRKVTLVPNLQT